MIARVANDEVVVADEMYCDLDILRFQCKQNKHSFMHSSFLLDAKLINTIGNVA